MDDIEDSHDLTEAEVGKCTEAVHNESKKAEKSEVSDAEKTGMGDGQNGDKVTDNSVNVEQLDRNVTDVSNDSKGSDLDID